MVEKFNRKWTRINADVSNVWKTLCRPPANLLEILRAAGGLNGNDKTIEPTGNFMKEFQK
jgi:hypothetical protein